MRSLAKMVNEKLSPHYYGPHKILAKIGVMAYQMELQLCSKIHSVFHMVLLEKVIYPTQKSQPRPEGLTDKLVLTLPLEVVLDCWVNKGGHQEL